MSEELIRPGRADRQGVWKTFVAISAIAAATISTIEVAPATAQPGLILNETVKLFASDTASGIAFGGDVAISGDTAVVGAIGSTGNMPGAGAVYVFARDPSGTWSQQVKLIASDGVSADRYGKAVAISGDTIIVGAPFHSDTGFLAGAVYVYVRNAGGGWTEQTKIVLPANTFPANDLFGYFLDIDGDSMIIGAIGDSTFGLASGAAYIYVRSAGTWTQQAKLLASDGSTQDGFAQTLAIRGDTAVIGAWANDDACPTNADCQSGSAYIFIRDTSGVWTQQAKILAADAAFGDNFGVSVATNGVTTFAGAWHDDDLGSDSGSVYNFTSDNAGTWTQQSKLHASDGILVDGFGFAVAADGATCAVGASFSSASGIFTAGAAYAYVRNAAGDWPQQAELLASDAAAGDQAGSSIDISGSTVIVGAPGDDDACPPGASVCNSGAVYIFDLPATANPADLNGDGVVNGADLATLLTQWGTNGPADLNNDGVVNGADLATLLTNWG